MRGVENVPYEGGPKPFFGRGVIREVFHPPLFYTPPWRPLRTVPSPNRNRTEPNRGLPVRVTSELLGLKATVSATACRQRGRSRQLLLLLLQTVNVSEEVQWILCGAGAAAFPKKWSVNGLLTL